MSRTTLYLLAVFVLCLDQLSKVWAVKHLPLDASVTLIPNFLFLTRTTNTGSAFGLFPGAAQVLAIAAFVAAAGIVVYVASQRTALSYWLGIALALPLGGALGNFIDRVRLQYVVDFIDVRFGSYHYPIFNVADSAICIGVAILAVIYVQRPADASPTEPSVRLSE